MPTKIPLVDRSRLEVGMGRCEHKRYLEYYAYGSGIKPVGQFVPLTTGTYTHEAVANILLHPLDSNRFASYISDASSNYEALVRAKGFYDIDDPARIEELVQEQKWLIECLAWGFVRAYLPWILSEYNIVCAEQEETLILGCTCGLNATGLRSDHEARDCNGVCLMSRPDLVLEKKATGELISLDTKTVSDAGYSWRQQFEDSMQLTLQLVATEQRLEKAIVGSYIIGLVKGQRKAPSWDPEGGEMQQSPLCYAYLRDDQFEPDLKYSYFYEDEEGKKRAATKSKGYEKTAAWKIAPSSEAWVMQLPDEVVKEQFVLLGPFSRPSQVTIDKLLIGIYGNELRWHSRLRDLEANGQETVDFFFPKSWQCKRYNSVCPYLAICKDEMLEPLESGRFEKRIPHHDMEVGETS